jgi:hypothetical protein
VQRAAVLLLMPGAKSISEKDREQQYLKTNNVQQC